MPYAMFGPKGRSFAWNWIAIAAYIAVTIIFYFVFKPVNRNLSLIAALFSMAGSTAGILSALHLVHFKMNLLIFFGFYCVLIGYLILRSTFLPRFLGALMILAGLGYLTYLWPPLASFLHPWNLVPGGLGEWTLTIWMLVKGVDQQRWDEQRDAATKPVPGPLP